MRASECLEICHSNTVIINMPENEFRDTSKSWMEKLEAICMKRGGSNVLGELDAVKESYDRFAKALKDLPGGATGGEEEAVEVSMIRASF